MKINSNAIKTAIDKIQNGSLHGALFYGPDSGVAALSFKHIQKGLGERELQHVSYEDLVQDPQKHLMNLSLFGIKPILKVRDVAGVFDKSLKMMLDSELASIPFFFAGELPPSSAMRKFFEAHSSYAAIACYNDDHIQVGRIINSKISSAGKTIEPDAVRFLEHHLTGNRMLVVSELDKLLCYAAAAPLITLQMAEDIIAIGVTSSADLMCIHFALSEQASFEEELVKLLNEGISPIWVIRALLRYMMNLYMVHLEHEYGVPYAQAIKNLRPTIFFKYVPAFKNALERTNHAQIMAIISDLCNLEQEIKKGNVRDQLAASYLSVILSSH